MRIPICSSGGPAGLGVEDDPADARAPARAIAAGHDVLDRVGAAAAAGEQHVHRAVVVDLAERDPGAVRSQAAPRRRQRVLAAAASTRHGVQVVQRQQARRPAGRPRAGAPWRRRPPARMTDTTCSRPAP